MIADAELVTSRAGEDEGEAAELVTSRAGEDEGEAGDLVEEVVLPSDGDEVIDMAGEAVRVLWLGRPEGLGVTAAPGEPVGVGMPAGTH